MYCLNTEKPLNSINVFMNTKATIRLHVLYHCETASAFLIAVIFLKNDKYSKERGKKNVIKKKKKSLHHFPAGNTKRQKKNFKSMFLYTVLSSDYMCHRELGPSSL